MIGNYRKIYWTEDQKFVIMINLIRNSKLNIVFGIVIVIFNKKMI